MRRSYPAAVALALFASAPGAQAATCGEGKHCFVHNRYTPNKCWEIRRGAPTTSVLQTMTPTPAGPNGSPGPRRLGRGGVGAPLGPRGRDLRLRGFALVMDVALGA